MPRDSASDAWWCGFCGATHRSLACLPSPRDARRGFPMADAERDAPRPWYYPAALWAWINRPPPPTEKGQADA